jgi:hypothetical protein
MFIAMLVGAMNGTLLFYILRYLSLKIEEMGGVIAKD